MKESVYSSSGQWCGNSLHPPPHSLYFCKEENSTFGKGILWEKSTPAKEGGVEGEGFTI